MDRRHFMLLGAAAAIAPAAGFAKVQDYTPGLVKDALKNGETVFLDFKASWCSTCAAQERVINNLKAQNPEYDQAISFVNVDWDLYGQHEFTKSLNIPRRSTLVVLKADQELGRLVAQTGQAEIKALMDVALKAAKMS